MEPAAIATPHGTMSLRLHNRIRVDLTLDRSVRVINFKVSIKLFNDIYLDYSFLI